MSVSKTDVLVQRPFRHDHLDRSLWRLADREGSRISKRPLNELSRFSRHAARNGIEMDISQGAIFAHVAEESHQAAAAKDTYACLEITKSLRFASPVAALSVQSTSTLQPLLVVWGPCCLPALT